jgi:hypothetical protein
MAALSGFVFHLPIFPFEEKILLLLSISIGKSKPLD